MLRMLGSRPGCVWGSPPVHATRSGAYEVRDFDAHSSVEVGVSAGSPSTPPSVAPATPTLAATPTPRSPVRPPASRSPVDRRVPPRRPGAGDVGAADQGISARRDRRPGAADDDRGRGASGRARLALRRAALARVSGSTAGRWLAAALRRVGWELKPGATLMAIDAAPRVTAAAGARVCGPPAPPRYGPTATTPPGPRRAPRSAQGARRRRDRRPGGRCSRFRRAGPPGREHRRAVRRLARARPLAVDRAAPTTVRTRLRGARADWGPRSARLLPRGRLGGLRRRHSAPTRRGSGPGRARPTAGASRSAALTTSAFTAAAAARIVSATTRRLARCDRLTAGARP